MLPGLKAQLLCPCLVQPRRLHLDLEGRRAQREAVVLQTHQSSTRRSTTHLAALNISRDQLVLEIARLMLLTLKRCPKIRICSESLEQTPRISPSTEASVPTATLGRRIGRPPPELTTVASTMEISHFQRNGTLDFDPMTIQAHSPIFCKETFLIQPRHELIPPSLPQATRLAPTLASPVRTVSNTLPVNASRAVSKIEAYGLKWSIGNLPPSWTCRLEFGMVSRAGLELSKM